MDVWEGAEYEDLSNMVAQNEHSAEDTYALLLEN